jgi:hypothetical protein
MTAGKTVAELMKSRDERVRLDAAKYGPLAAWAGKTSAVGSYSARISRSASLNYGTRAREAGN